MVYFLGGVLSIIMYYLFDMCKNSTIKFTLRIWNEVNYVVFSMEITVMIASDPHGIATLVFFIQLFDLDSSTTSSNVDTMLQDYLITRKQKLQDDQKILGTLINRLKSSTMRIGKVYKLMVKDFEERSEKCLQQK